jgi:alpha-ketoglutarate-dependent taurine dioxygenase
MAWRAEAAMTALKLTRLHPSLGAEVAGVDLSQPLDAPTRAALARALADHLALVFRAQRLTPAQYLAAAAAFGPPMEQHYSQHNMPEFPLIGLIWHRNGQQPAEQWHTDHTNRECPPPRLAHGRRARHRRPRDDAPCSRRLRPAREPDPVADHRGG